ncbi:MAG TPA: hypothetical protein VHV56_01045 [Pseudolabrys sp.]|jgi:hypothetical protein|nr:hypothetical protein [Pseudolabrys sp.]
MENPILPDHWHDLYVMLGTSSAALLGLLFVVTSLHLEEIVNNVGYRRRARSNSYYLIITLVEGALVLTPQPIWSLGAALALVNGYGLTLAIRNAVFIFKDWGVAKRAGFAIHRSVVFNACFLIGLAGGVALVKGANWGMHAVTISNVALLVSVALNAWAIMLGVGESEKSTKSNMSKRRG